MIRASRMAGPMAAALMIAACQTNPMPQILRSSTPASMMDGRWASSDGIFVASFAGDRFTSSDARTQAVLAEGSYRVDGQTISLNWVSARTQQQHSAVCTMRDSDNVHCDQAGATGFDLRRSA